MGLIAIIGHNPALIKMGMGYGNIFTACYYLVLVVLGWETKSRTYIKWAFGFYVLDTIASLAMVGMGATGILMRILFIRLFWLALNNPDAKSNTSLDAAEKKVG